MSDYISKDNVIDVLKETGIIQDNDLGHLVVDEINRIPTVDEKEIIRKPFERIIRCIEKEFYELCCGDGYDAEARKESLIEVIKKEGEK